jgi:hypothetical protein
MKKGKNKVTNVTDAIEIATPEVTNVVTETPETAPEVVAEVIAEATETAPVEAEVFTSSLPPNATIDAHGRPIVFVELGSKTEYKLPLGRPSDPNSERQKRLAEMALKREAGMLRKGRPVVADSERQKRLAEMALKRVDGAPVQKGRPIDPNSPRQKLLAERAARIAAGMAAQLGRPPINKSNIDVTIINTVVAEQVVVDELDDIIF